VLLHKLHLMSDTQLYEYAMQSVVYSLTQCCGMLIERQYFKKSTFQDFILQKSKFELSESAK